MKHLLFLFIGVALCGCGPKNPDDDLRTVPVTNNHNLIPHRDRTPGVLY